MSGLQGRHWSVFYSSLAALLVTVVVGPLLGSLLEGGMVSRSMPADFVATMQFAPTLLDNMSMSFSYVNYANRYLNADLPSFMTSEYALTPFAISNDKDIEYQDKENWTVPTTVYFADMKCIDAITTICLRTGDIPSLNVAPNQTNYAEPCLTNGLGQVTWPPVHGGDWSIPNGTMFYALTVDDYDDKSLYYLVSLATRMGLSPPNDGRYVSTFCRPQYWSQSVKAIVGNVSGAIVVYDYSPTAMAEPMEINNETFLYHAWLYGAAEGSTDKSQYLSVLAPFNYVNQTDFSDVCCGIETWVKASMVGDVERFFDRKVLVDLLKGEFKFLFASAVRNSLMMPVSSGAERVLITGQRQFSSFGIVVEYAIAMTLIATLVIVSLLNLLVLLTTTSVASQLIDDPDSIATQMTLASNSPALLERFSKVNDHEIKGSTVIHGFLDKSKFCMILDEIEGSRVEERITFQESPQDAGMSSSGSTSDFN